MASLRLGHEMWSFVPSTGRVQQVPETMMLSAWMGSDWSNDDMVRDSSLLDDYRIQLCEVVEHEGGPAYKLDLRPRKGREVSWAKQIVTVRKGGVDDLMPLVQEYYSRRAGALVLARTMHFSDHRQMGGRACRRGWSYNPPVAPGIARRCGTSPLRMTSKSRNGCSL